jgi:2-(1,2-epoxy-1,2-dihydrophenyl)acetyl-CoA isomerase
MADLLETTTNHVTTLTLNRPASLNALSVDMVNALVQTLHRLNAETNTRAIVITGAGRAFCAGGDVKGMAVRSERSLEDRIEGLRFAHQVPYLLRTSPKVVVAMINGVTTGAGLALALACDFRLMARSARLGTAFAKIGLTSDWGATWSVTRLVGTAKARELFLLPEMLDSTTAESIGLVTRVVDDSSLLSETTALAERLAEGPQIAYANLKRSLFAAETEPFQTVLDLEAVLQARTGLSEDHREARSAFLEKRKPVFTGR